MATLTTCRSCSRTFEVPAPRAGAQATCPHCGAAADGLAAGKPAAGAKGEPLRSKPVIDRSRPPVTRKPLAMPPPAASGGTTPPAPPPVAPVAPAPSAPVAAPTQSFPPIPPDNPDIFSVAPMEGAPPVDLDSLFPEVPFPDEQRFSLEMPPVEAPPPVAFPPLGTKPPPPPVERATHSAGIPGWAWGAVGAAGLIVGVLGIYAHYSSISSASKDLSKPLALEPKAKTDGDGAPAGAGKAQVARSLDQVLQAIVKIETPVGAKVALGTGFFIDARGWIATNHHIARDLNTGARVTIYNGARYELAGVIATAPERDLAIIKIAQLPRQFTTLDIGYRDRPRLGLDVYAAGNPRDVAFTLTKGIVSRVLTFSELQENHPERAVGDARQFPLEMLWIQHDAKIAPGNSGGPLIDEKGKVLGINTFGIFLDKTPGGDAAPTPYGYASHVRYLRELAERASDAPQPLPAGPGAPPVAAHPAPPGDGPPLAPIPVSGDRMRQLYIEAVAFQWKPTEPKHYDALAELAKIMTAAKHTKLSPTGRETIGPQDLEAAVKCADELFGKISKVDFNEERVKAITRGALAALDQVGAGAMVFGTVVGSGPDVLLLAMEGAPAPLMVPVPDETAKAPRGSRWLVLGILMGATEVPDAQGAKVQVRPLLSHYLMPLKDK